MDEFVCSNCFIIFKDNEVEYDEPNQMVCPYCGAPQGMLSKFRIDGKIVKKKNFSNSSNNGMQNNIINSNKVLSMLIDSFDIENKIKSTTDELTYYAKIQVLDSYRTANMDENHVKVRIKELKDKLKYLENIADHSVVFQNRLASYIVDISKPTSNNLLGRELSDIRTTIKKLNDELELVNTFITRLATKVNKQQNKRKTKK